MDDDYCVELFFKPYINGKEIEMDKVHNIIEVGNI